VSEGVSAFVASPCPFEQQDDLADFSEQEDFEASPPFLQQDFSDFLSLELASVCGLTPASSFAVCAVANPAEQAKRKLTITNTFFIIFLF